jgi:hypothetical protein
MGIEATSLSEQATAARRDYFAGSNSGVVGQDARDVGDVVEKFKGAPRCRGKPPAAERHRRSGACDTFGAAYRPERRRLRCRCQ